MAVTAEAVSVGTTATALNDGTPGRLIVSAPAGAATIFLGGSDVDTTEGFPLAAGERETVLVDDGEILFGIVSTGSETLNVLRT